MVGVRLRRLSVVLAGTAIGLLLGTGTALANGPCGNDFDGSTACAITTATPVNGILATDTEFDYYVFYAKKGTQLTLTITDTEDPTCAPGPNEISCGFVFVELYDSRGSLLGQSNTSSPNSGFPDPEPLSRTLPAAGTYYAVVTGETSSAGPIPYSLTADGTPSVTWPPPCTVPRLRKNTSLGRAKSLLALHYCSVGRVRHVRTAQVRRGRVVGLRPRAGAVAPYGHRIGILLSAGP